VPFLGWTWTQKIWLSEAFPKIEMDRRHNDKERNKQTGQKGARVEIGQGMKAGRIITTIVVTRDYHQNIPTLGTQHTGWRIAQSQLFIVAIVTVLYMGLFTSPMATWAGMKCVLLSDKARMLDWTKVGETDSCISILWKCWGLYKWNFADSVSKATLLQKIAFQNLGLELVPVTTKLTY